MHWQTSRFLIDLHRPQVMGIVNVTPDSFADAGRYALAGAAMAHCEPGPQPAANGAGAVNAGVLQVFSGQIGL